MGIRIKLKNRKLNKKEIKLIILAGGATSNLSIIDLFRKALPNMTIVSSDDPEIAVVKGAVYFAKNPSTISKRIARFSLGVKIIIPWIEKYVNISGAIKLFDKTDKKYVCPNGFAVFYKKYQAIDVNSEGKKKIFNMTSEKCSVEFYKSDFDGPVYFVDQKSEKNEIITKKFGTLEFSVKNFDNKKPEVEIEIKLGGTFISAKIIYLKKHFIHHLDSIKIFKKIKINLNLKKFIYFY